MQGYELKCVSLYANNQGAIALAKHLELHQRSKHIDMISGTKWCFKVEICTNKQ